MCKHEKMQAFVPHENASKCRWSMVDNENYISNLYRA